MAIQQPVSGDKLSSPDHSLSHRVFANDDAAPVKTVVVDAAGATLIGGTGGTDYMQIAQSGHMTLHGAAVTWRDEIISLVGTQRKGARIVDNTNEGTTDFANNCDKDDDYVIMNCQLNHDRDHSLNIFPHVHYWQFGTGYPNWLIQYRWQVIGGTKTEAWTDLKCNTPIFNYTTGIIHQLGTTVAGIAPPSGTNISDIVQFRLARDVSNESALFAGTDIYSTGNVSALSFDVHIGSNSLGSNAIYSKN